MPLEHTLTIEQLSLPLSDSAEQRRAMHRCVWCSKTFQTKPSKRPTYCSKACMDQARRLWKPCLICGTPFRGHTRQKYCGRACGGLARRRTVETRRCEACGVTLVQRDEENNTEFRKRRSCSRQCTAALAVKARYRSGSYPEKADCTCEQCGEVFQVAPSHLLNTSNGSVKRFCSRKCKGLANRGKWPLERTNLIPFTCTECGKVWHDKPSLAHRKKFCSRTCLGQYTVRRLQVDAPTSIELVTYQALKELDIEFEPQAHVGRWLVDAFLPEHNIIVECQGTFHHADPRKYPRDGILHPIQKKTIARDTQRHGDFIRAGMRVIYLWEMDIHNRGALALLTEALGAE